nr:MAG TPA: hypothetical protein [Caudoviricetes sp.]
MCIHFNDCSGRKWYTDRPYPTTTRLRLSAVNCRILLQFAI